jgi:ubiquinone/menaquinone biosynthesis C-methylase UbiE
MDLEAFRKFEREGWAESNVAKSYVRWFDAITSQSVGALLDAAGVESGVRVLDLATGPGGVARAALARGAKPVGVDLSPAMIEVARSIEPKFEVVEADAQALPFPEESFDAVVMSYGLLHLPEPERGVAEAFRVLRPGGRFAFTVWATPDRARGLGMVIEAIRDHGNPKVSVPPGPPFFRFSDPDESRRVLIDAGFETPEVSTIEQTWIVPSVRAMLTALEESTVRTRALLRGQTKEELARIERALEVAARPFASSDGLHLPMASVLACARKPR